MSKTYIEIDISDTPNVIEANIVKVKNPIEIFFESTTTPTPSLQSKSVSYFPSESWQSATVTPDEGYDGLDEVSVSVGAIPSTYVGSEVERKSSLDLTASGATVTAPAGYYANEASKTVASGSATASATKGSVSDHSITVTPSVTRTAGYITAGTESGTPVTVTAEELISFSTIYTGGSVPSPSTGVDGDVYLQV